MQRGDRRQGEKTDHAHEFLKKTSHGVGGKRIQRKRIEWPGEKGGKRRERGKPNEKKQSLRSEISRTEGNTSLRLYANWEKTRGHERHNAAEKKRLEG